MLIHEVSDPLLAAAKICKYLEKDVAADVFFVIFSIVFTVTRLVIFPMYILTPLMRSLSRNDGSPDLPLAAFYLFGGLVLLCLLSIVWTFYILKVFIQLVTKKEVTDARSIVENPKVR